MATPGFRFHVMETSRRRAAAKGSWPFGDEVDAVVFICSLEREAALACSVYRPLLAEVLVHVGRPGGASIDIRPLSFVHLPPVVRGAPTVFSASEHTTFMPAFAAVSCAEVFGSCPRSAMACLHLFNGASLTRSQSWSIAPRPPPARWSRSWLADSMCSISVVDLVVVLVELCLASNVRLYCCWSAVSRNGRRLYTSSHKIARGCLITRLMNRAFRVLRISVT